jgi:hypothetical protein
MEQKFKQGEVVYERVRPTQKLIITNHSGMLYYCIAEEHPNRKELVFTERELVSQTVYETK